MLTALLASMLFAGPSKVVLANKDHRWTLTVDSKPFLVKGAGGSGDQPLLVRCGANSIRTWGVDTVQQDLDTAQKNGLKVAVGIWLGHKEHGFKWDDPAAVRKQFESAKAVVEKYKNHPAVLLWSLGNEMEGYGGGDDPNVWNAVQDLAKMVHQTDPNHPTMTVVAEIGGNKIPAIHRMCPDIDIVGINSYAGAVSIYDRYTKQGGTKPYILTEFGPPGPWEVAKTLWDRPIEPTSTQKAATYTAAYRANVTDHPDLCLGSYAFTWGNKQETTSTWFGMFLPDGTKVGAVDAMQALWSGKPAAKPCPVVELLVAEGPTDVPPGTAIKVKLTAKDPQGSPLTVAWHVTEDNGVIGVNGQHEDVPNEIKSAITESSATGATVKLPANPGNYRVFAFVRNAHGGAATANLPLKVKGDETLPMGAKVALPFDIYRDSRPNAPFSPAGWMGNAAGMKLDVNSTKSPHSGTTCIQWDYNAADNWAGVAWQNPDGDWGDLPGGFDLTGAKRLVFWARGQNGGEEVSFGFGLIKPDKKYADTTIVPPKLVTLKTDWQRFELDLAGRDLRRIKMGLVMIVAGQGKPITSFVDDVVVE